MYFVADARNGWFIARTQSNNTGAQQLLVIAHYYSVGVSTQSALREAKKDFCWAPTIASFAHMQ